MQLKHWTKTWVQFLAVLQTSCMALGKSAKLSVPLVPICKMETLLLSKVLILPPLL